MVTVTKELERVTEKTKLVEGRMYYLVGLNSGKPDTVKCSVSWWSPSIDAFNGISGRWEDLLVFELPFEVE